MSNNLKDLDLKSISALINDISADNDTAMLRAFLEHSGKFSEGEDDDDDDNFDSNLYSENGRIVLFNRNGLQTDLFSIGKYIDELL